VLVDEIEVFIPLKGVVDAITAVKKVVVGEVAPDGPSVGDSQEVGSHLVFIDK